MGSDSLAALFDEHDTWMTIERGLAPNSLAAYRRDLARYRTFLADRGLSDTAAISTETIADFARHLRALRDDDGLAVLAEASIARTLVAVRSLHRFAVAEGLAKQDPTEEIAPPRVARGMPKALSEPDVERLLAQVTGDDPAALRDRAILETLYASGLRISELVGLDLDDLELGRAVLHVLGKGAKERIVPVGSLARGSIEDYLVRGRPILVGRGAGTAAVFVNQRGGRLTRQGVWGVVRTAAIGAGLDRRVTPHVLRHSCATHLLDHGADIRVVQEILGHASISTTQVYTMVTQHRIRAAYDAAHPRARVARR